jgi:hypothetical protein
MHVFRGQIIHHVERQTGFALARPPGQHHVIRRRDPEQQFVEIPVLPQRQTVQLRLAAVVMPLDQGQHVRENDRFDVPFRRNLQRGAERFHLRLRAGQQIVEFPGKAVNIGHQMGGKGDDLPQFPLFAHGIAPGAHVGGAGSAVLQRDQVGHAADLIRQLHPAQFLQHADGVNGRAALEQPHQHAGQMLVAQLVKPQRRKPLLDQCRQRVLR